MHRRALWFVLFLTLLAVVAGRAQNDLSELLEAPGVDMREPAQREQVTAQMAAMMQARHEAARTKAQQKGLPLREVLPNGRIMEVADFAGEKPLYFITHNANAAISTGANLLQQSPFSLTGSGLTVGIWDGGGVRSTHQELTGRVTIKDGAALIDHSTHVGGTIGASGVQTAAKGMATAVNIDSYEWTNDKSEQATRGASYPGEASKIYVSNHSYGIINGWNYTGLSSPMWTWWGNGTTNTSIEQDFGRYEANARDEDSMAFSLPYYLIFRSAGNDRLDNPSAGQAVSLTTSTASAVTYDPALHPAGDGTYRNGYDTVGFEAVAKNVITIGSVGDAVSGGVRSLSGAYMSSYSSWGPTDDGRIKPDIVANGENLYSSFSSADTAYGTMSGTSMATPNATGSSALLINWWNTLCPGHYLRASTLKGLIIHTADDLGNAGPDYQFGWGLMNVKAAADLLQAFKNNPGTRRVIEDQVTTSKTTTSYIFTWDGNSAIRATLCWTDPIGAVQANADVRTPNLVNNLDLKITGPTGTIYRPWVMPFVGDWSNATLASAATTGINNTDNVERVDIASPGSAGVYTVTVSYQGTLTNNAQNFSVIVSGGNATATAPVPTTGVLSPNSVTQGTTAIQVLNLAGSGFLLGANVKLTKTGQSDVSATGLEVRPDAIVARLNAASMAPGLWNVVVTNPDGQSATLANGYTVVGNLWSENFESGAAGWTHSAATPTYTTDTWALSTVQSSSATHSYFASGPSSKNICDLYSPVIAIPAGSSNLQIKFYRYFNTQSTRDGVVLEFSVDGGAWFDAIASGSGAAFASGGYNATLTSSTSPIVGRSAWTGSATSWTPTIVSLTDNAKYPGHSLQMRWRMTTNQSTASTGFYLDDVSLSGATAPANQAPTIASDAFATPTPVTALTTTLTVLGDDDAGESALTYTWAYTGGSFERQVSFNDNGTNSAKTTTATFSVAGAYTFTVTARDAQGLTVTSSVDVTVTPVGSSVSVSPATVPVPYAGTQSFTASVLDQFGDALAVQPGVSWLVSGGGAINSSGIFTASSVGGPYTVTATSGSINGTASVSVTKATATMALSNLSQIFDGNPKPVTVATTPANLSVQVTYNGSATVPSAIGSYAVAVTITDANYQGSAANTLTITGLPLSTWKTQQFSSTQITAGDAADDADPDHDGLDNLAEYALGTNPNQPTPMLTGTVGVGGLFITFTRPKGLPDVTYAAESSTDLITWTPVTITLISDGTTQTLRATDPLTAGDPAKRFLRLRFTH